MYNVGGNLEVSTKETVEQINSYPIRALKDRGITKETCEHFNVRVALSEVNGTDITAIYYPYYENGVITWYKKKDLTKPKGSKGHFTTIGKAGVNSELFGQNIGPSGGKKIFITEGENDALAAYQVLKDKYSSGNPAVVSIGLGTTNAAAHIGNNLKYIKNFSEVVVAFDQDQATEEEKKKKVKRGKEATQEVAQLLPNIKVAEFTENDPNDMLLKGKSDELYWALVSKAKVFVPETIKFGRDIPLESLLVPLQEGIRVDCFPKLMDKLHGFRPGEMTILLAPTKSGKTTVAKETCYGLLKSGSFVGFQFLEESIEKTMQSLIALDNNVLLPAFRENPNIISREAAQKTYDALISSNNSIFLSASRVNISTIMDNMRYMAAMGAKTIVLDHLSYVLSSDGTILDERRSIDLILTELASFKKEANVHIIVVAHITRKGFQPKKDKDGDIIYPYWIPVNKEDGRGSGAFEQLCDNLIVIEPEVLNEGGERGRIRLKVSANREWDLTGIADVIIMDRNTGRMINAEQEMKF